MCFRVGFVHFENQLHCRKPKKNENIANVNLHTLSLNEPKIIAISERLNNIEHHDEWVHNIFAVYLYFHLLKKKKNAFDR